MAKATEFTFDDSAARLSAPDLAVAVAAILGTALLFYIDSVSPRGILDGIGYPVVVTIAARFGRRPLLAWTALCTILIFTAQFLVPDAGIGIGGEIANRAFGIASIWIIAYLMNGRLLDEAAHAARERLLRSHQAAMSRIVRDILPVKRPLLERIRLLTEIAAQALNADLVGVFRFGEDGQAMHTIDLFEHKAGRHGVIEDLRGDRIAGAAEALRDEGVVALSDVMQLSLSPERREVFGRFDVRAAMSAAIFIEDELAAQIWFARVGRPHVWDEQEKSFAKTMGNIATYLFAMDLYYQTVASLDVVREGIYIEDNAGAVVYANRAAIDLASQALSATDRNSVPWNRLPFPKPPAGLEHEKDHCEIRLGEIDLEISRSRLPNGGIIVRINDVTERNLDLQRREKLHARLREAEKLEAIGRLAGGVAHDFNNIIGAIMGFASFLDQDLPEGSEQRNFAKRILAASERAKELVQQILTFARMQGGDDEVAELGTAVDHSVEILKATLPPSIELGVTRQSTPLYVRCSAARLSQLIYNLFINARDAIGDRRGTIKLTCDLVAAAEVNATVAEKADADVLMGEPKTSGSYARICMRDTGKGIEADVLRNIFEPFFTTKGRGRGTGLGLAVVHGVIASTGGVARVRSTPGEGTEFLIYLPTVEPASSKPRNHTSAPIQTAAAEKILVVDDEPDIVDMMVIGLERLGFRAVGVGDPLEALEAFKENPSAFDVVITDLIMPSLRGTELAHRIKSIRPGVRTILCTAFSDGQSNSHSEDGFVDAFFRKPVDATTLAECIQTFRGDDNPVV